MKLKKALFAGLTTVLVASAIVIYPNHHLIPNGSILANAADTRYTSGFWTYVKYSDGTVGIAAYAGLDKNISIPSKIDGMTVTKIEDKAFYNNKNISTVNIPGTVNTIGYMAFSGSGLTSITIPATVTKWGIQWDNKYYENYGSEAFSQCEELKTAKIETETVPEYAFNNCSKLKTVTLGVNTKYIKLGAFENDKEIETFNVNSDLYEIGSRSFFNCKKMKSILLGNKLKTIGYVAFAGSGLTSITIPETVTAWGTCWQPKLPDGQYYNEINMINAAFAQCENLKTVSVASEEVPICAFLSCSKLETVTLGTKTKYIKAGAFENDVEISVVNINSNLYKIGGKCFWNCKKMKTISLGNKLETIGYLAFAGSGLTSITIPNTVTTWETTWQPYLPSGNRYKNNTTNATFAECPNLTEVNVGNIDIPSDVFLNSTKVNIHCIKGTSAYNCAITNGFSYTLYDKIPSTSVSFANKNYTMIKGTTLKLYPILAPQNSTDRVSWTIGNTDIVKIDAHNVVTAKDTGVVSVRCTTDSGKTYTFNIEVVANGDTTKETEPVKDITLSEVKGISNVKYTGNATTQSIKVMFNPFTELIPNVDYSVSYKNNTNVGTATVTLTGKGSYKGSISKTYTIYKDEASTEITETKDKVYSDRITINWKPVNGAKGYNIYINDKKVNTSIVTENTYTIKNLDKNTDYNISVATITDKGEAEKSVEISAKTGSTLLGDINGDQKINIIDAMRIFHYVSGRNKNIDMVSADINGDGKINIIDAMKVFHYVSGRNKNI